MNDRPPPNGQSELYQPTLEENAQLAIGLTGWLSKAFANTIHVFTRSRFGGSYFDFATLCAIPIIELWGAFHSPADPLHYHALAGAWFAALIFHRGQYFLTSTKRRPHSLYNGFPWLCNFLPIGESTAKAVVEPGIVALIGWGISLVDLGLGQLLMLAAAASVVDHALIRLHMRGRLQKMRDAEIEHGVVLNEFDDKYEVR